MRSVFQNSFFADLSKPATQIPNPNSAATNSSDQNSLGLSNSTAPVPNPNSAAQKGGDQSSQNNAINNNTSVNLEDLFQVSMFMYFVLAYLDLHNQLGQTPDFF